MEFIVKRKDNKTAMQCTLLNKYQDLLDLTGCTAKFVMRTRTDKFVEKTCTLTDAKNGSLIVVFSESDLNEVGVHRAHIVVTFSDGRKETFPNDSYIDVKIFDDLYYDINGGA